MNPLLHLGCTLDEVDPPRWPAPGADATRLVRTVHALRHSKLGDLRPGDLRMLVAQRVALHCTLPLAALLLLEEPLLEATFYPGDLLLTAAGAPESGWAPIPDLRTRLSARDRGPAGRRDRRAAAGFGRGTRPVRREERHTTLSGKRAVQVPATRKLLEFIDC
ncbi:contact-dependent growth inhibition system immunity protein [Streptomyces sp. NPDC048243]|uniref:contact-dependent growth inhibition system immunity protein n=1 Tax=Streptomyces sp. NPDC048243 TaxID=3365522 RepID=UPI00371DB24B